MKKFPEVPIEEYIQVLDDKAIKVTELKEDYIIRRKALTTQVKAFLQETLPQLSSSTEEDKSIPLQQLVEATKSFIEVFKKEYDHLSNYANFRMPHS